MYGATIAFVATAAQLLGTVSGHGMVHKPTPRQECNELRGTIGSGGNGAGQVLQHMHQSTDTTSGTPSVCGDPFLMWEHVEGGETWYVDRPCEPQVIYQQGSVITIETHQTAPHGGFYEFAICDNKDALTQDCFDRNTLISVRDGVPQWYIHGTRHEWAGQSTQQNPKVFHTEMILPADLTCEHCVLMWTWWTGHICGFDCDESYCGLYSKGLNPYIYDWTDPAQGSLPKCQNGRYPPKYTDPQIFRNCIDIKIEGGSGNGGAIDMSTPSPDSEDMPSDVAEFVGNEITAEVMAEEQAVEDQQGNGGGDDGGDSYDSVDSYDGGDDGGDSGFSGFSGSSADGGEGDGEGRRSDDGSHYDSGDNHYDSGSHYDSGNHYDGGDTGGNDFPTISGIMEEDDSNEYGSNGQDGGGDNGALNSWLGSHPFGRRRL